MMERPPDDNEHDQLVAAVATEVLSQCLAGRLRLLNRMITGQYDRALKPLGLTGNRVTVLAIIAALDEPTATEIQPYVLMEASTLSRTLARLERTGFLNQRVSIDDRRANLLELTSKGKEVLIQSVELWREAQAWAESTLGDGSASAIRTMAKRINPLIP